MKFINRLLLFTFLLFPTKVFAETDNNIPINFQDNKVNFHTNFSFGYDYNFGFAKIDNTKVLLDKTSNLVLDDRFRNSLYIQNFDISLNANLFKILNTNISVAALSNGFTDSYLNDIDSYREFQRYLEDRKNNLKFVWTRFGVIKDVNFELKDTSVDGNLVIGQQLIPFGFVTPFTFNQPVTTTPMLTPMTDYINFNLRDSKYLPYQNSSLTNIRDIGVTMNGNFSFFKFATAIYNGSGTNIFDNNNEKDYFGRLDFATDNLLVGLSHLRGRHVGYKNIFDTLPTRDEFESYKTGFHSKLGNKNAYLLGEFILAQEQWLDKTSIDNGGWYIEGCLNAENIISGTLRYETFYDNNVLKNKDKTASYGIKRFVANLSQNIGANIISKEEYSHTWEDVTNNKDKLYTSYDFFSANLMFKF